MVIGGLLAMVAGTLIAGTTPAAASTGIQVFVAYADSLRPDPANFPIPWYGSTNTIFYGCHPVTSCEYDGGAVRVVNNTGSTVPVNDIALHINNCTYTGWWPDSQAVTLPAGWDLIVTQLQSGAGNGCTGPTPTQMDMSDIGPNGADYANNCTRNTLSWSVDVTTNNVTTSYTDSGQVLNTGGLDASTYCGFTNESIQWTVVGTGPCRGVSLSLSPATQTHVIGQTATIVGTFTNSCGQPLSDVPVNFVAATGPNAGFADSRITDANGNASLPYTSTRLGTDTWSASVANLGGIIPSKNSVTVTWIGFAPGGGAFVISDLHAARGGLQYWWGAQWWKKDPFSNGTLAPASFKGFEKSDPLPACGDTWTTRPGNSPHPPATVPAVMAVIVASHVTKKGSVINGNILHIVLVDTRAGYGPNPGHPGTGVIVGVVC